MEGEVLIYPARSQCRGLCGWCQSLGMLRCRYCGSAVISGHLIVQRLDMAEAIDQQAAQSGQE